MNVREALRGPRMGLELQRAAADEIARLDARIARLEALCLAARDELFSENPLSPTLKLLEEEVPPMSTIRQQTLAKSWRKGVPPSIGWWPTRFKSRVDLQWHQGLRWWDGKCWSLRAYRHFSAAEAGKRAQQVTGRAIQPLIQYRERPASWPARSRT